MDKIKAFFASAYDWAKRVFGRSKTIFTNVLGLLSMVFVEMSDSLTSLNLDDFFKHQVAVTIGLIISVLNIVLRYYTDKPVSFSAAPVAPVAPVSEVQSPKAE